MKVFEILQSGAQLSEEQIVERIKAFDWKFEFSDDVTRINRGNRELALIESSIYGLWKHNPDRAVEIWNSHAPTSGTGTPSFILRMQMMEGEKGSV